MSIEIPNPNFRMFLNVRTDNQRNWISKTFNGLSRLRNYFPPRENRGTFVHDQKIYLIFIMFFVLNYFKDFDFQCVTINAYTYYATLFTYNFEIHNRLFCSV